MLKKRTQALRALVANQPQWRCFHGILLPPLYQIGAEVYTVSGREDETSRPTVSLHGRKSDLRSVTVTRYDSSSPDSRADSTWGSKQSKRLKATEPGLYKPCISHTLPISTLAALDLSICHIFLLFVHITTVFRQSSERRDGCEEECFIFQAGVLLHPL